MGGTFQPGDLESPQISAPCCSPSEGLHKGFVRVRDLQWPSHAVAQWRSGAAAGERLGPEWVSASAPVPVVRPDRGGDRPLAFVDPAQVLWWSKPRHTLSLSWGGSVALVTWALVKWCPMGEWVHTMATIAAEFGPEERVRWLIETPSTASVCAMRLAACTT